MHVLHAPIKAGIADAIPRIAETPSILIERRMVWGEHASFAASYAASRSEKARSQGQGNKKYRDLRSRFHQ